MSPIACLLLALVANTLLPYSRGDGISCTLLDMGDVPDAFAKIIPLPNFHIRDKKVNIGFVDNCSKSKKVLKVTRAIVCNVEDEGLPAKVIPNGHGPLSNVDISCRAPSNCSKGYNVYSYQYCEP